MIVEGIVLCMGLMLRKFGNESRSWKSSDKSESAALWKLGDVSESAAYGRARQSFLIGAVEYLIPGVVSVRCDGVGAFLKGGDDEMKEEGQHVRRSAAT